MVRNIMYFNPFEYVRLYYFFVVLDTQIIIDMHRCYSFNILYRFALVIGSLNSGYCLDCGNRLKIFVLLVL